MNARERLIVPLDVATADAARSLVARLSRHVGMFKVGNQLFTAAGPSFVRELVDAGHRVFLDLKYHDIPNTVGHAVAEAARLRVSFVDVHASGGRAMLKAAVASRVSPTRVLAITVLTSHDETSLRETGVAASVEATVGQLARLARDAGVDGVVASPQEVESIRRACGDGFLVVTPGIRPAGSSRDDQARAAAPAAALRAGADYLVVGRPITAAPDPAAAAAAIVAEMEEATAAV